MKHTDEQTREEQRFTINYKTFKAAARAFDFVFGKADDLEDAIQSLSINKDGAPINNIILRRIG